ncbi:MAG: SIMPL domain-containing protein [Candidatus Dojkabacteria bacterium]
MNRFLKDLIKSFITYAAKATYVFALVMAVMLLAISFFFRQTNNFTDQRTFQVEGSAERDVEHDIAQITVGSYIEGKDVVTIQNQANTKISQALDKIKALGISEEKIKTSNYSVSPEYDYEINKIDGYSVNVELRVEIENIKLEDNLVGDVIAAAAEVGLNEVRNLSFDVKDRDEILDELKLEAIADAKQRKDSLAAASGLRLGELKNIDDSGGRFYYDDFQAVGAEPFAGDEAAPKVKEIEIQPGETELTSRVTLVYEIL